MKNEYITALHRRILSGEITPVEATKLLVNSGISTRGRLAKWLIEACLYFYGIDWHYAYSDDGDVYRRGVLAWERADEVTEACDIHRIARLMVGRFISGVDADPLNYVHAEWDSKADMLHIGDRWVGVEDCVQVTTGVGCRWQFALIDEDGIITLIRPPVITREMVMKAAENGAAVVSWRNWQYASMYMESEAFYGWRLIVRPFNRERTKGAIFVVPTITDTRRIHRAGKIKRISEVSGQPLLWAKSYYARSSRVKYAFEDRVVEKVAGHIGVTYEEWQAMPETNSRERAAKRMVALLNQFEGA